MLEDYRAVAGDAERAARAALPIQRSLGDLNRKNAGTGKPELAAHIGVETGHAVVDAAGEIYGDVANVAARVQTLAEPGAVMITARVQRQIAGLFVVEERGTQELKGVPEPTACTDERDKRTAPLSTASSSMRANRLRSELGDLLLGQSNSQTH
jgi:class 3 adenylate cyclase